MINTMAGTLLDIERLQSLDRRFLALHPAHGGNTVAPLPFTDFSSVNGVLTFNLFSVCPNLLLNIALSYRGFRQPLPVE